MMRFLLTVLTVVLLSACVSVKPVRDANNADDRVVFGMDGRIGVQYIEHEQDKSFTGKMQWEETLRATDVVLSSPIGNAMASLHITKEDATLKTAAGESYVEKTPEALLQRLFGYELPLTHLRQMIGTANTSLPEMARYDGWEIKVLKRYSNPNLAKKILITRQQPTQLTMTLVIDERSDAPNE